MIRSSNDTGKGNALSGPEATVTACFPPPCPTMPTSQIRVRSRSVGAFGFRQFDRPSPQAVDRARLFRHRRHHCHHRLGRRFGIQKLGRTLATNTFKIFAQPSASTGHREARWQTKKTKTYTTEINSLRFESRILFNSIKLSALVSVNKKPKTECLR